MYTEDVVTNVVRIDEDAEEEPLMRSVQGWLWSGCRQPGRSISVSLSNFRNR